MWKNIIYKEWLKTRWFIFGYIVLGLMAIGYIFLSVQHDIKFFGANNYWYGILFQGLQFFGKLKFLPLLGGLAIGIAQYFPETVNKRIKLTFHLPVNENRVILSMMLFGLLCLLTCYLIFVLVIGLLSANFFPREIIMDVFITMLPWFLGGFIMYFLVALIVLEPIWKYRIFYAITAYFFISIFYKSLDTAAFARLNPYLVIIAAALSIVLLFSSYRFRKGEM